MFKFLILIFHFAPAWANPGQGTGYARFVNMAGQIIKLFNTDFGSEVSHNFTVDPSNIVSVNELTMHSSSASIYPNPTAGELTIDLIVPEKQDVTTSIYNSMGQVMLTKTYANFHNEIIDLNISGFESGFYFVKFVSPDIFVTKKIILNK